MALLVRAANLIIELEKIVEGRKNPELQLMSRAPGRPRRRHEQRVDIAELIKEVEGNLNEYRKGEEAGSGFREDMSKAE
jgi:hypothetical protein